MNVRETSQRVAAEYWDTLNGESLPEAIERAIREAAEPLVKALVLAQAGVIWDRQIDEVLAEWRAK